MMSSPRTSAVALHANAAKRLLRELEQQSETALHALGQDGGMNDFIASVDERDRILAQLGEVVEALSQERIAGDSLGKQDPAMTKLLAEMAHAAAAALESHDRLAARTRRERDRLAESLERSDRTDSIAHQYGALSSGGRSGTLSVTG